MGQAWMERAASTGKSPKTPKSHYTQAYKGGIILSLSFKWLVLHVTHSNLLLTDHNVLYS